MDSIHTFSGFFEADFSFPLGVVDLCDFVLAGKLDLSFFAVIGISGPSRTVLFDPVFLTATWSKSSQFRIASYSNNI